MAQPQPWSRPPNHPPKQPRNGGRSRPVWPWLIFAAAVIVVLVVWLMQAFPGALDDRGGQIGLVHGLILITVIGAGAVLQWINQPRKALRDAGIWAVIVGGLFLAYSVRHEAVLLYHRVMGDLTPGVARTTGDAIAITASQNGHFIVMAEVNGVSVRFLVDTGASDVVLSPRDAGRIGFNPETLDYTKIYSTANGTVRGAPVILDDIVIGGLVMRDVSASVNGAPLSASLLGMSYLNRLSNFSFQGDRLVLRP